MQRVMPQPLLDQQTWCGGIRLALERSTLCTRRLETDRLMSEAEREAAAGLRSTIAGAVLSTSTVAACVLSAALGIADPVNIGVGGSVILRLAYLQQLCVPAEIGRNLAVIPALGSRRLRILRLVETLLNAATIAFLYVAGPSLIGWSIAKLLRASV